MDAKRDWGYAKEYVEAMWRMLQQDTPDDYVIATGETHSVQDFCVAAFSHGFELEEYVQTDEAYHRLRRGGFALERSAKAREQLGWEPEPLSKGW